MTPYGFDEGDVGVMSDNAKKIEESGKGVNHLQLERSKMAETNRVSRDIRAEGLRLHSEKYERSITGLHVRAIVVYQLCICRVSCGKE